MYIRLNNWFYCAFEIWSGTQWNTVKFANWMINVKLCITTTLLVKTQSVVLSVNYLVTNKMSKIFTMHLITPSKLASINDWKDVICLLRSRNCCEDQFTNLLLDFLEAVLNISHYVARWEDIAFFMLSNNVLLWCRIVENFCHM